MIPVLWRRVAPVALGLVLTACGQPPLEASPKPVPPPAPPPPSPSPSPVLDLAVPVSAFHEPGDYAHRNYCVPGATEVLLSAWMEPVPPLEQVAAAERLNPATGAYGADAARGVNSLLAQVVPPVLGRDRYTGEHLTTLVSVEARIRADLGDPVAAGSFGHTVPLMVQVMTRTLPGWSGWQATHMVTIAAASLRTSDPGIDTVTYAETPSPLAGYSGPDFQTITLDQLWAAMQAFLQDDPSDPINVIA